MNSGNNNQIKQLNIKGMPNTPATTPNNNSSISNNDLENEMENQPEETMDINEPEPEPDTEPNQQNNSTNANTNANTNVNSANQLGKKNNNMNKPNNNMNKPNNNTKISNMANKNANNKRTKKRNVPENLAKLNKLCINMLNHQVAIKLYHFQTKRYGSHKASDSYLDKYMDLLDKFLEVAQGIHGRITIEKYDITGETKNDENIFQHLDKYSDYLENDINDILANNTDLINIRDEIVGEINQLSYLLTFM